jgi:hypothetical protein
VFQIASVDEITGIPTKFRVSGKYGDYRDIQASLVLYTIRTSCSTACSTSAAASTSTSPPKRLDNFQLYTTMLPLHGYTDAIYEESSACDTKCGIILASSGFGLATLIISFLSFLVIRLRKDLNARYSII